MFRGPFFVSFRAGRRSAVLPIAYLCWLCIFPMVTGAQSVVISEFMASNDLTLRDQDGDANDWVELHNRSGVAVDVGGWYLTDSAGNLDKWQFPSPTLIPASGFLVVFASGKNRAVSGRELHADFSLDADGEYVALVAPDGMTVVSAFGPNYPRQFTDVSYGFSYAPQPTTTVVYFTTPTPKAPNNVGGSVATSVTHRPAQPTTIDRIVVEAALANAPGQKTLSAQLYYRVDFGGEQPLTMADDGMGDDRVANDGIWTTAIPSGTPIGRMVRWRVTAPVVGTTSIKAPRYHSATNSPQYFGTMVQDPTVFSQLPILQWFIQNPSAARTTTGTRCGVYYLGEFYDNVFVRRRGANSSGWTKKHFKFDFNTGHHFRFDPNEPRVEEFNLNSTWPDKAFVRQSMSFDAYKATGGDTCLSFPIRVQQNRTFHSVGVFVEQPDERYLRRQNLDPQGALYKMYNILDSATRNVEKKTRQWEGRGDLQVLVNAVGGTTTSLETYLFDNIDVPAVVNYMATLIVIHENDHLHKNHYLYRDTRGDGEWRFLPWDKDLTLGRIYLRSGGILNDTMYANVDPPSHPFIGKSTHRNPDQKWNRLIDAVHRTPRLQRMYLRRLRTVMDQLLQPPGTPRAQLKFEQEIDRLKSAMTSDVALDQARWGVPAWGNRTLTFAKALTQMENDYLRPRRVHLYTRHGPPNGVIPAAQAPNVAVDFGRIEASPASNNQDEEYVEIVNCNVDAVDMSGWNLFGGIRFTFPPGTVLPAGDSLFVVPDVATFRRRTTGPGGAQRLFVVGPYIGHLKPSESLTLYDTAQWLAASKGAFAYSFTTSGFGDASVQVTGATPSAELFILFSTDTRHAIGCGPVPIVHLGWDVLPLVALPLGTAPFHVPADAAGGYSFSLPTNTLPPALQLESRVVHLHPTTRALTLSQIVRVKF